MNQSLFAPCKHFHTRHFIATTDKGGKSRDFRHEVRSYMITLEQCRHCELHLCALHASLKTLHQFQSVLLTTLLTGLELDPTKARNQYEWVMVTLLQRLRLLDD